MTLVFAYFKLLDSHRKDMASLQTEIFNRLDRMASELRAENAALANALRAENAKTLEAVHALAVSFARADERMARLEERTRGAA